MLTWHRFGKDAVEARYLMTWYATNAAGAIVAQAGRNESVSTGYWNAWDIWAPGLLSKNENHADSLGNVKRKVGQRYAEWMGA